ncbi:PPC domain-containing protein [Escherichia coli]|uniref:PPC domain-containing protein n=1 Tax=Escherichia coli TaxID=562 RepID=UPI003F5D7E07
MTSLKTSIKTITYLSDTGCLEIQGASLAGKNVNVEFRKGHSSAQYSGEIKGYDYDTYTFYAKKGQKVHVSISNEGADTYLFGPGIDDSVDLSRYSPELDSHGQYSLPASGKYELRVLQTRNDARKNKTKKYNVDIQIK